MKLKRQYCSCLFHYVCYGGYICMNRNCGKPHEFVKKLPEREIKDIFKHPRAYMVLTTHEDGTREVAWAKKDGSMLEEIFGPFKRRKEINRRIGHSTELYILKNTIRHILEGLKLKEKRFPKGEPWYTPFKTRWWYLKRRLRGMNDNNSLGWFLFGYKF